MSSFELAHVIVNYGTGSRVLHKAREYGISSGTVYYGTGTVSNHLLSLLSLHDVRKEIVSFGADSKTIQQVIKKLNHDFTFDKPNHGIMFTTVVHRILGAKSFNCSGEVVNALADEEENDPMYQIITTVVNRGLAEDVIEAAKAAGSKGGTVINARGSGTNETAKLFAMEIEPEKEVAIIIAKSDVAHQIIESIRVKLEIDKPGNGIIFVQDVKSVYGIYE